MRSVAAINMHMDIGAKLEIHSMKGTNKTTTLGGYHGHIL